MIVGEGEVDRYIVIYFRIIVFEFRNVGVFFVVIFWVKFVGKIILILILYGIFFFW